jgi:hypothetical protein
MSLHYLIADAITYHGGSTVLVQMLNRVGACASLDTVNRIHTAIAAERIEHGIESFITANTLSIVSIDNIDILQPWTIVSCMIPSCSWHGTSIQCVQPQPSTITLQRNNSTTTHPSANELTNTGKRACSSPIQSPKPKQCAKRQRNLKKSLTHITQIPDVSIQISNSVDYRPNALSAFTFSCFKMQDEEELQLQSLRSVIFKYMLLKEVNVQLNNECGIVFSDLMSFISTVRHNNVSPEKASVAYIDILSLQSDSKETVILILDQLHTTFIVKQNYQYLLVAADAKLYDILQAVRKEYGVSLDWLLPFPGDWHMMFNYQKVLTKIYWDAGLLQLAQVSGHRAETLTSLAQAKNFRRTHTFLLEVYEAIYRSFILQYLPTIHPQKYDILKHVANEMNTTTAAEKLDYCSLLDNTFSNDSFMFEEEFQQCVHTMCESPTCLFWSRFLNDDALAYVALFSAVRNSDWTLRMGSFKLMVPIYFAFDRPIYQRVTCTHIADVLLFPKHLLDHLCKGAFTVNFTARQNHDVAIDEAHEMGINKHAKSVITRPEPELMKLASNTLMFRSACMENLKKEVNITNTEIHQIKGKSVINENITKMMEIIQCKCFLSNNTEKILNNLNNTESTPEQKHDLLMFREVGLQEFETYVNCRILNKPSTTKQYRRKQLLTFTVTKREKSKAK